MLKRAVVFILALGLIFCAGQVLAQSSGTGTGGGTGTSNSGNGVITSSNSVIHVHIDYNAYGVATKSTQTSTTTTTTSDGKGGTQTETSTTVTTSTWHGGSLKADSAVTTINSTSSDGSTSTTTYTDNYVYSSAGKLQSVSGSGTMTSKDGETGHVTSGTITRSFIVKDGQALLTNSTTTGTIKDKDGKQIGTFTNATTISEGDYQYLGGSWVPMRQTSTSTTTMATDGNMSSTETVTRTLTYTRNSAGVITGMSQTATGTRTVVNGVNGGTQARQTFTMTGYKAEIGFDSKVGYYVKSEDYSWTENTPPPAPAQSGGSDPWTKGTLAVVDGKLALIVNPEDVNGFSTDNKDDAFYNADPSKVTGETKKDANGNMIFMLGIEDASTYNEMLKQVGKEINVLWQHFTKSSENDTGGYGWLWLSSTADSTVSYHLKNDNAAKVEQWGGTWDRSKQYVIIN